MFSILTNLIFLKKKMLTVCERLPGTVTVSCYGPVCGSIEIQLKLPVVSMGTSSGFTVGQCYVVRAQNLEGLDHKNGIYLSNVGPVFASNMLQHQHYLVLEFLYFSS